MKEYILELLEKHDNNIHLVYSDIVERFIEENNDELLEILSSLQQLMVIEAMFEFDTPYDENQPYYFRNMYNTMLNELLENL